MMLFFFRSLTNGAITTRASAIAFSFFLALFPTAIFLFTLIPYVPIDNFQQELFLLIGGVLPPHTFQAVDGTLKEVLTQPRGGLLSAGFFMGLIFSTPCGSGYFYDDFSQRQCCSFWFALLPGTP